MSEEDTIVVALSRYMIGQQILGRSIDDISAELMVTGWDEVTIREAVAAAANLTEHAPGLSEYSAYTSLARPEVTDFNETAWEKEASLSEFKAAFHTWSVWSLILVNLIPVGGAIFLGWDLSTMVALYWFENIVVGLFAILKIYQTAKKGERSEKETFTRKQNAILAIFFFVWMFGLFEFVLGSFLFSFFKIPTFSWSFFIFIASLFVSHGISYVQNFIGKEEYLHSTPEKQLFAPLIRMIPLNCTVIFGIFGNAYVLIFFKTLVDIDVHIRTHRKAQKLVAQSPQVSYTTGMESQQTPAEIPQPPKKSVRTNQVNYAYVSIITTLIFAGAAYCLLPSTQNTEPIESTQVAPAETSQWNGEWTEIHSTPFGAIYVSITNATATAFNFDINANWQAHNGEVQGIASVDASGITATWTDTDTASEGDGNLPCTVSFKRVADALDVVMNHCENYGGLNVFSDTGDGGTFKKNFTIPDADFTQTEIFTTEAQRQAFKQLVGPSIKSFNDSRGLCQYSVSDAEQICFVAGVANDMANILVLGKDNTIWAAVLDDSGTETKVDYFTTAAAWKNKLPAAIKEWNEWGYAIVYKSK